MYTFLNLNIKWEGEEGELRQERKARCQATKGILKGLDFILMALGNIWWVLNRGMTWFIHFAFSKYHSSCSVKDGLDGARLQAESFGMDSIIASERETMAVAIGMDAGEWDGEISEQMSRTQLAIGPPHRICNMIYILLFIWSKYDLRFHANASKMYFYSW